MVHIRPANLPQDTAALAALDTSFVTNTIYSVAQDGFSFQLSEMAATPPMSKRYPIDLSDPEERARWHCAVVAEEKEQIVGFAAAEYASWNRRVMIWHLYVAPNQRGRGVGAQLLAALETFAHKAGARCLWLETQNVNVPAIRFYWRAGFTLCGVDTSLYDPALDEIALFFTRPVPNTPPSH